MKPLIAIAQALAGSLLFISCNNTRSYPIPENAKIQTPVADSFAGPPAHQKTAAELRRELAETEASDPTGMLLVTGQMQENKILVQKPDLFHHSKYASDGYLVNGFIRNKASIAKFKDAIVRITFYTETRTELDHKDCPVYKYFLPNETTPFELKVYPPENTKDLNLEIINASVVR